MKHMNVVKKYGPGVAGFMLLVASSGAMAEVPTAATAAFTEAAADFGTLFAAGFAVLVTIVVAMAGWKYTRKLGSKL
jgi:hypothetical protein